jgi:hypothetical protein
MANSISVADGDSDTMACGDGVVGGTVGGGLVTTGTVAATVAALDELDWVVLELPHAVSRTRAAMAGCQRGAVNVDMDSSSEELEDEVRSCGSAARTALRPRVVFVGLGQAT